MAGAFAFAFAEPGLKIGRTVTDAAGANEDGARAVALVALLAEPAFGNPEQLGDFGGGEQGGGVVSGGADRSFRRGGCM